METKKTMKCDAVVVGGGNAGLCTVLEAANRGISVLLLEKAPRERRGGNSRVTGGVWRVPHERGREELGPLLEPSTLPVPLENIDFEPYPKDAFYAAAMRVSEGLADKYWTELIVDQSLAMVNWLFEQGVKWELASQSILRRGDRVYMPAGEVTIRALNLGEGLVESLYSAVEAHNIPVLYETAAQSLIVNAEGEVCGVIAKTNEGMIRVEAKSVILACGGFEANTEMRRRYLGEGWDLAKLRGTRYNTGDGLRMSLEIGAQPHGHWGGCHASVVSEDSPEVEAENVGCVRYSFPYCIMVNVNGERFMNEGENIVSYTYADAVTVAGEAK